MIILHIAEALSSSRLCFFGTYFYSRQLDYNIQDLLCRATLIITQHNPFLLQSTEQGTHRHHCDLLRSDDVGTRTTSTGNHSKLNMINVAEAGHNFLDRPFIYIIVYIYIHINNKSVHLCFSCNSWPMGLPQLLCISGQGESLLKL